MVTENKQYWAFISYSSKDRRWGEWLHRRLESYPIPAEFRGLEVFDGAVLGKNLRPVFRDRDELSSSADLGEAIRKALEASRFLVVLCSKNAAKSKWVNKEIEDFQAMGKGDRILALILDGEPNATAQGRADDECFPPALRYPAEPIAGDLRKEGDGKERGFLKILAGIAQLDFDKLYRRHERAQARKRLIAGITFISLLTVFAVLASFAWLQKNEAEASRRAAEESQRKTEVANQDNLALIAKNKAQLHAASMADYAIAVERIEGDGKWHAGIAHLGKAVSLDPENAVAAVRLYSELSLYATKNQNWPIAVFHHEGHVNSAIFSPDGRYAASASDDRSARIWGLASGKQIGKSFLHEHAVESVCYSPDGTRIFTVASGRFSEKTGQLWDVLTGTPIGSEIHQNRWGISVDFSPDGSCFVTAGGDSFARLWDARTGLPLGSPIHHEYQYLNHVSFSSDGTRFITSSGLNAEIWHATTGERSVGPMKHLKPVNDARFSPDGRFVATASGDNAVRIWDAGTGAPIGDPFLHDHIIKSLRFSPDGIYIVSSCTDQTARIWEVATGRLVGSLKHEWKIDRAYFSPDGWRIVTSSEFGKCAQLWDVDSQTPLGEPLYHDDWVSSVQFSPDGRQLITSGRDNNVRVWSAEIGKPVGKPIGEPLRHPAWYTSAIFPVFNSDKSRLVTVDFANHSAQVWDVVAGSRIGAPLQHGEGINSVQFSPDGQRVVTASSDRTAKVWDARTGAPTGIELSHESFILSACFSPDGNHIATAGLDSKALIWNAATGVQRGEALNHDDTVNSACFSPDGTHIVTASDDKTAKIWTLAATNNPVAIILHHDEAVEHAEFSLDGRRIITRSGHYTRIWDAGTGKLHGEPMFHRYVKNARLSPDGAMIVTTSADSESVLIWDANTGKRIGAPIIHETRIFDAYFSADGMYLTTADINHVLREWDLSCLFNAPTPVPVYMAELAQAIAGQFFNEYGELVVMPPEQRLAILQNPPMSENRWARLARWVSSPIHERTHTPDSDDDTFRQLAQYQLAFGYFDKLQTALRYDTTLPIARLLLANSREKTELAKRKDEQNASVFAQCSWMRHFDLAHLPDDADKWLQAAIALNNAPPGARTGVGSLAVSVVEDAVKVSQKALDLSDGSPDAKREHARAMAAWCLQTGDSKKALLYQREWIDRSDMTADTIETIQAYWVLAQLESLSTEHEAALLSVKTALNHAAALSDLNITWLVQARTFAVRCAILGRIIPEALIYGEKAVALLTNDKSHPARMNLAHAYLFNGQFEKAKAIYAKHLGTAFEDGRTWNDELRNDFNLLRSAGYDHPDMAKIEDLLPQPPPTQAP